MCICIHEKGPELEKWLYVLKHIFNLCLVSICIDDCLWSNSKATALLFSVVGYENAYAIQAGREIRVIVDAEKIDDESAMKIARDIANKIEGEMVYPGEIQVTLLREVRCIEYAK